jgi:hypothetical protein
MTFSDMRTLMPIAMSEFTATAFAAISTSAKSITGSSDIGNGVSLLVRCNDRPQIELRCGSFDVALRITSELFADKVGTM